MFASLAGGWILIPEIPSVPVSWTPSGHAFLILGVALAILGLHHEWRGPRRWSALLPGIVLLLFTTAISAVSLWRTAGVVTEGVGALELKVPRSDPVRGGAVLLYGDPADRDLLERLAARLARMGVATGVAAVSDVSAETSRTLRERWPDLPVGLLAYDEAGAVVGALDGLPVDFLAVLAAEVPDGLTLPPTGPRLLGIYGFEDTDINPHEHGRRLLGAFSDSGRPGIAVQMMLGADHQLRRTAQAGFLPASFAPSLVERLADFMSRPTA